MSASNAFETLLLQHLFNNAAMPNFGDATGLPAAGTAGSLYVSAHTGDPGEAGTQATNEATVGGYARVAVARTSGGWTVSNGTATNTATVPFPVATSGSNVITHLGVGTLSSGAGTLIASGAISPNQTVTTGVILEFAAGQISFTVD